MQNVIANQPVSTDPAFGALKDHIIEATGLAYYLDKDPQLATKVQARLAAVKLPGCRPYLELLRRGHEGENELNELAADLTIGETFFFRHREQFDALRETVLPEIIRKNQESRRLRLWHAGCSIGAEPYSAAILLEQNFGAELAGWDVSIIATDINRRFLGAARDGRFNDWALRSSTEEFRRSCFVSEGLNWTLREPFRRRVSFQYHNLARHPFPSLANNLAAFDIIFCRNVMMYFDRERMRHLVGCFRDSLVEGGWMLVGPSETDVELFREFRTVNVPGTTLYQKTRNPVPGFSWPLPSVPKVAAPSVWQPAPLEINVPLPPPVWPPAPEVGDELVAVRTLADHGDWKPALNRCQALLTREPLRAEAHFFHALLLENMGELTASEQALRKAIYLDRNYALPHYHLGLLLRRRGDKAGAGRAFRNFSGILSALDEQTEITSAEGMTVADLKEVAESELEMLQE